MSPRAASPATREQAPAELTRRCLTTCQTGQYHRGAGGVDLPLARERRPMLCPQCQFDNRDGIRFCEECGAKLEQVCPACSAAVPPGRKFCGECGARLAAAPAAAAQPPVAQPTGRFTSPQTYTPQHLAERILTSRVALEGERKQVTVLF